MTAKEPAVAAQRRMRAGRSTDQIAGSTASSTIACISSRFSSNAPSHHVAWRKQSASPRTAPTGATSGVWAKHPDVRSRVGPRTRLAPDVAPMAATSTRHGGRFYEDLLDRAGMDCSRLRSRTLEVRVARYRVCGGSWCWRGEKLCPFAGVEVHGPDGAHGW